MVICLLTGTGGAAAQEPPLARAALIQCLMTAADPGERVDGICSRLAQDVCGVGRSEAAAAECRAELACRFVEEGRLLQARGSGGADWAGIADACRDDGRDEGEAGACRRDAAQGWWIAMRAAARLDGIDLQVADREVARCFLD